MTKFPFPKDPADSADYTLTKWNLVLPLGDTVIAIAAVAIEPVTDPPLVEDATKRGFTTTTTTLWLSGGKAGTTYTVSITATTAGGRQFQRSALLPVKEL